MESSPQTDPAPLAGTVLERKFRVDRLVAEGGFGFVYVGHHLALDLPVAIKVLKRLPGVDNAAWQEVLARFIQEAQTMARLRHPNIVSVLDTGIAEIGGGMLPWIVLEWLDGITLAEDLDARRGRGGRPLRETLDLVMPVVHAVAEAHQARIAHRDLKPGNVMLVPGRQGQVTPRVLDFGVAKSMNGEGPPRSGHTTTGEAFRAFSRSYAAPEQLAGARTGPWTDVHALGLMLTEVLVDASPYSDEPTEQHARAFDAVRPTPARFGVDAGPLEEVIARATAIRPADRFADAVELLAAIERATGGLSGVARGASDDRVAGASTSGHRRRQRAPLTWAVVGLLAVTGAVLPRIVASLRGEHGSRAEATEPSPPLPATPASAAIEAPALARPRDPLLEQPIVPSSPGSTSTPPAPALPPASRTPAVHRLPRPARAGPSSPIASVSPPATAPATQPPAAAASSPPGRPPYVPE
jgi:serine/threonine-protein kinase